MIDSEREEEIRQIIQVQNLYKLINICCHNLFFSLQFFILSQTIQHVLKMINNFKPKVNKSTNTNTFYIQLPN